MPQPSIKQLEAFWWAATCANFATAAERVHLSVSSLSKRIAELEATLGQPLFDRSGHRAVLTEAGERLLPATLGVLNAMAVLGQTLDARAELVGHCRFGVGDLSALTWLPAFVAAARQAHPQLGFEPYVDVGGVLERRLADGELDFAVIAGRSSRGELLSQPVGAAHFTWAAAPGLTDGGRMDAATLLQRHPLVTLPQSAGTTRLLDDWLLANRATVHERIACNSWGAVAGMLRQGVGVGFLPASWVNTLKLRTVATLEPLAPLHYAFQWRRGDTRALITALQPLVQAHVDFSGSPRLPM
ncbi:LysR family transcriptional regulator [Burkholderia gladioli pv. gladioli]|uniref:Bacterial regulatory helix-turn-helix, lysR family protein n=1 Tax=Burkholderia gladioli TaxID=28095 RepID=A0AAW3EZK1_BURGA|nr:LysR family transcriptional regulator [Burkholderia gladioli]AJW95386.1 bacterial regulatory helix-turn-helix, lysR family protein [Burkholderia gladioli]ASD82700.1 LysR family transcriptional regulator [Burkholderia gladioli pv. gladioli]AWY50139.1 LysR family transcriptional regulator [Burkholderia gladioli pv. gladioli]KGC13571.1 bacterial regulatory helix-turn-helix, lysR family protein [Burkholderia gladioli]MDJ1164592.1 LysR family transcriptional regulator [Burkholderia gladioli pv. 